LPFIETNGKTPLFLFARVRTNKRAWTWKDIPCVHYAIHGVTNAEEGTQPAVASLFAEANVEKQKKIFVGHFANVNSVRGEDEDALPNNSNFAGNLENSVGNFFAVKFEFGTQSCWLWGWRQVSHKHWD
jgi:nanoRNase/pAp phosphatase (c-di-AMP/oligoRNAs hydrolase)